MTKYALNLYLLFKQSFEFTNTTYFIFFPTRFNLQPVARNLSYLLFAFLCIVNKPNVYAQAQILAPETSVDIFKSDYLLNQEHRYNPDFIRAFGHGE